MADIWWNEQLQSDYGKALEEQRALYPEHRDLGAKLRARTATAADSARLRELNARVNELESRKREILDTNPMLPKNLFPDLND